MQEDLLSFKQELLKELSKMQEDAAMTEATLVKVISGKYNWLVAVLTAPGSRIP